MVETLGFIDDDDDEPEATCPVCQDGRYYHCTDCHFDELMAFFFKYICTILGVFWHAGMKFVLVKTSRFCPAQVLTVFLLECLMDISNAPPAHDGELYVSSCAKLMTNNNYMCIQWSWYRAGEPSRGERVRNRCHERISALFVAVLMYDEQRKLI